MNTLGKTLATIGGAWLCLLAALLVYDYVQDAPNGESNLLFAGWSVMHLALAGVPGIALVILGLKITSIFKLTSFD